MGRVQHEQSSWGQKGQSKFKQCEEAATYLSHTSVREAVEEVGEDRITKGLKCQAMEFEVYHGKEWRFLKGF